MNSGFVEAGSGKSISLADWPLLIHTDYNSVYRVTTGEQVSLHVDTRIQKRAYHLVACCMGFRLFENMMLTKKGTMSCICISCQFSK